MRILIVGGGIASVYTANKIKELSPQIEVIIVSDESYMPYDRIHLCRLVDKSAPLSDITLELNPEVVVELNCKINAIDTESKRVISEHAIFKYDKLIIATGSKPRTLFNIDHLKNASTFRSADDSYKIMHEIKNKNVVIVGVGPIGLELLDTLIGMKEPKSITLISRNDRLLYDDTIDHNSVVFMKKAFTKDSRVQILFDDAIVDKEIVDDQVIKVITKQSTIEDPFIIFGVGIMPNIDFTKEMLDTDKGVLVNDFMQSSDPHIYVVGEAAQLSSSGFIAGHIKACTDQADVAIASILKQDTDPYVRDTAINALKVCSFMLNDVTSPFFDPKDKLNETILIGSQEENRIDQYVINEDKLVRFIGINTNIDLLHLSQMMQKQETIDPSYFYQNRLVSERGRLVCSCEGTYELDLIDIIKENAVTSFSELKPFTQAGR
ncbi:MAG: FAD-dependent oxidoreductase, partial [Campylobacterota bacterium]|nr:FAD-dependent oxidoreductase [Campylobacterota bacterium]